MKRMTVYRLSMLALLILFISAGRTLAEGGDLLFAPAVYNVATDCTVIVTPSQNIQTALNNASSGDVVCVRAGTYHQQIQFRPVDSGITVQAYPGERPVLDGQASIPDGKYEGLIHVNASNVTVEGFDVFNSAGRGIVVAQLSSETQTQQNVVIRNNIVRGSTDAGININGNANNHPRNILIEGNVVYGNLEKNTDGADNGGSAVAFLETDNSVARGNVIYNNLGEGLVADRWTSGLTFEDNVLYDNKHAAIYLSTTQNPVVRRNYVFCTDDRTYWRGGNAKKPAPGIVVRDEDYEGQTTKPPASNGQVIINNIVVGCGNNLIISSQMPTGGGLNGALIANNSFVNARGDAGAGGMNILFEGDANYANSRFVNNLILQSEPSGQIARILLSLGTPDMSSFNVSNNLYSFAPANKNWIANEPGRVIGDPRLVNPTMPTKTGGVPPAGNYALQAGSPAINAGTAVSQVTEDYFKQGRSGAHDIGADEQGGGGGGPTTGNIIIALSTIPDQASQSFNFTASYVSGGFQLTDNQTHNSGQMAPGTYSVSQSAAAGWATSASCSDGSQPSAIALAAGETVTCTFTNQQEGSGGGDVEAVIYLTTNGSGTVGGVTYNPGDILAYDGAAGTWSPYFDGSDVGVNKAINDFVILSNGSLLVVHSGTPTLPVAGGNYKFMMQDVALFTPTSLGSNTAGTWSVYFDGSDVGLSATAEKIDALARRADGALLISTYGTAGVPGGGGTISAQDEDLLAFQPSATGANTQGTWSLGLNGTAVPGMKGEDLTGAWQDAATGNLYLTMTNDFIIGGVAGTSQTIIALTPSGAVSAHWNAADAGFGGPVDGLHLVP